MVTSEGIDECVGVEKRSEAQRLFNGTTILLTRRINTDATCKAVKMCTAESVSSDDGVGEYKQNNETRRDGKQSVLVRF